jgi:hypothetical protein
LISNQFNNLIIINNYYSGNDLSFPILKYLIRIILGNSLGTTSSTKERGNSAIGMNSMQKNKTELERGITAEAAVIHYNSFVGCQFINERDDAKFTSAR